MDRFEDLQFGDSQVALVPLVADQHVRQTPNQTFRTLSQPDRVCRANLRCELTALEDRLAR